MTTEQIVVAIISGALFVACLCACCYLAGYKKGTQDIVKFHNSVWKTAEREALKDGKGD